MSSYPQMTIDQLAEERAAWDREACRIAEQIAGMDANWDGIGVPLVAEAIGAQVRKLRKFAKAPPLPAIFQTMGGGIQFLWSVAGMNLSLELDSEGQPLGLYLTPEAQIVCARLT